MSLMGNGVEQFLLFLGQQRKDRLVIGIVVLHQLSDGLISLVFGHDILIVGIELLEHTLHVPRVPLQHVVEIVKDILIELMPLLPEEATRKRVIRSLINSLQFHQTRALEEGSVRRKKDVSHQVTLAPRKDEMRIVQKLYVGSQLGLHAFLRIGHDLLELVYSHINLLARVFHEVEDLPEVHRAIPRLQCHRHRRLARHRIHAHHWPPCCEELHGTAESLLAFGKHGIENGCTERLHEV